MVQAAQQSIDAVEALRQSIVELNHSFRRIAEENQALPYRLAIDVGANCGDVSERLLQAGIEVYAFEPFLQCLKGYKSGWPIILISISCLTPLGPQMKPEISMWRTI
jgi:hypothetical protein